MSKSQRTASLLLALPLAAGAVAGTSVLMDGMATDYSEGRTYSVSMQTSATTTSEREMLVDGERREGRGGGASERTTSFSVAYTDEIVAADEGAPTKVRRAFEAASGGMQMEMRGEPMEIDLGSPFDGVTLMLALEEGVVEATVEDGDAPDDTERLEGHALRLPLDGLLPSDEVEAGDSWEIGPDALEGALGAGLSAKLLERPEFGGGGGGQRGGEGRGGRQRGGQRGGGMGDAVSGLFAENMEWEITGTLTDRTEEIEGATYAVIEIEASMSGDLPERQFGRGRGRDRAAGAAPASATRIPGGTIEAELEGELLWDAANSCPVRLTLTGEVESEQNTVRDTERGTFEINSSSSTELEITVAVTKAD